MTFPATPGVVRTADVAPPGRGTPSDAVIERVLAVSADAARYAHAPVSEFQVGVAVLGGTGSIYLGANLELDAAPLHLAVHAEQTAIVNALTHGERSIRLLAASAEPCGHCRQFLEELGEPELLIATPQQVEPLPELLPSPFVPAALGVTTNVFSGGHRTPLDVRGTLADVARRAAERSHAPYTGSAAGVAIRLENRAVIAGIYIESVAYNPSLDPLRGALALARFRGWPANPVEQIALVHAADGRIDHSHAVRETAGWLPEEPQSIEVHPLRDR